ncbi:uncharacterized protein SPAPADRAFT_61405 [Spathaspora passalidarum NRRL Y-27907]|uniref:Uncharacterized protein n=1 Tax=Spathaspora passalidarum (strain NRRL Y-27907 / 11-Y1) TaxID=619300 RepID=G3AQ06_SPAPN|nr:uncharacterized protein SPAPADRAFT_61405 [Spathaspora passalidarum NRRL Y-27907]EGW32326.1 hypothetical protein SPAPADRAFT_61405 [Spathaspora passalidarum NRRL Y-27907]
MFTSWQETMFFNPESPQEICPNIWLGPYSSLSGSFLVENPMQIIINCGTTLKFLDLVENDKSVAISSDVILLSLDPAFDSNHELVDKFKRQFTKILQHYLNFFYLENPKSALLMHKLPQNSIELTSPIISGSNLKLQFFNLIRLMTLFKSINPSLQILVVSDDGNSSLSTGLVIAYLMDCYRYNVANSFRLIQHRRPSVRELNSNFYDDLLIIEHLKKFYVENCEIKNCHTPIATTNYMLKRRNDECVEDEDDMVDEILVGGGDRKRRFVH